MASTHCRKNPPKIREKIDLRCRYAADLLRIFPIHFKSTFTRCSSVAADLVQISLRFGAEFGFLIEVKGQKSVTTSADADPQQICNV